MSQPYRTAGDIAEEQGRVPDLEQLRRQTASYGRPEGPQAMVNTGQLAAMLRTAHPSGAQVTYRDGWWEVRLDHVQASGPTPDVVAAAAVPQLRRWAGQDPTGATGDPVVWLVHTSTDAELRTWLGLP